MPRARPKRLETLGYDTLWLPETVGKNPFVLASWLLANTSKLKLATGIANIYHREPTVSRALQYTLAEQSGDRFMMAIGGIPQAVGGRRAKAEIRPTCGDHAQLFRANGHRAIHRCA